jgi:protein-S-isoprenylcysteine O-methyltransferase Ste14
VRALELKIPPAALGLLLGGLMWATARSVPALDFALPAKPVIAGSLAAVGVLVAVLGIVSFRRAKTTVNPLSPEAASALVTSGIYQRTRNPMYLGMLLVLLGWAVFLANILALVFPIAFVVLMNRLQILPEERALTAVFGSKFADYQSRVRRWL